MAKRSRNEGDLSRRDFMKGTLAAGAAAAAGGAGLLGQMTEAEAAAEKITWADSRCIDSRDLSLVNGNFIDHRGAVANAMTIKDGRIVDVGRARDVSACTLRINMRGRTVIPGLIDSSAHFTRTGCNPGFETRWTESAFSIAELQQVIRDRAETVPPGRSNFITTQTGWSQTQFVEGRLPTRVELDEAAPSCAVYLSGRTNSIGAAYFATVGIDTDPDTGQVSNAAAALNAIRALNDFDNKLRGTADAIRFAAANGLTSIHDPSNLDIQPDDYRVMNTLYLQSGRQLDVRMRHYRYFGTTNADFLRTYMDPIFRSAGDETYRIIGVGEQIGSDTDDLLENMRIVARAGWKLQQHTSTPARQVPFFKQVGTEFDLFPLRWNYCHPGVLTPEQINDLKSVGVGTPISTGPFRSLIDGGLQCGAMTDATNVAPLSPWVKFYYMVTGKTQANYINGQITNANQQITRLEALRLYTLGSAWFSDEDHELGSFEVGKKADLAVLTHDLLTMDEQLIPKIKSDLTLQGGRVVHASGPFAGLA